MTNLGEAVEALIATQALPKPKREHVAAPKGWEPGVAWDGDHGTITTKPLTKRPDDWDDLLRVWDLDPEKYEVVEPVQYRAWDASMGEGNVKRLYYYRATIRERRGSDRTDVEALVNEVRRHKKPAYVPPTGDHAFVVALSDWQIGKEDSEATVQRILAKIDAVADRARELRKIGRALGTLYVLGLGDIVEMCSGFYAMQTFTTELTEREQRTVARRLIVKALTTWAPLFERVVVAAVPGNHGENRNGDGKAYTTFGDSSDLEVFEQAHEILAASDSYSHVSFVIPQNDLTLALDVQGTIIGLAHGHQVRGGGTGAAAKVEDWWRKQQHGMRPVGEASILFTGHLHHLSITQNGPRTHFQVPTLDSGSTWFEESAGVPSIAGMFTVVIGPNGWRDLAIL